MSKRKDIEKTMIEGPFRNETTEESVKGKRNHLGPIAKFEIEIPGTNENRAQRRIMQRGTKLRREFTGIGGDAFPVLAGPFPSVVLSLRARKELRKKNENAK